MVSWSWPLAMASRSRTRIFRPFSQTPSGFTSGKYGRTRSSSVSRPSPTARPRAVAMKLLVWE